MSTNNIRLLPYSETVKEKLSLLVETILSSVSVECIVLFGSYARMEQKLQSDIDIFVLTEEIVDRECRGRLCSIFEENSADLIFYTKEQFETSDCLFVNQIREEGILLWKK